ncbi:MAG: hypothetical protein ACYCZP_04445 [Acidimicrobiales bacterium]
MIDVRQLVTVAEVTTSTPLRRGRAGPASPHPHQVSPQQWVRDDPPAAADGTAALGETLVGQRVDRPLSLDPREALFQESH